MQAAALGMFALVLVGCAAKPPAPSATVGPTAAAPTTAVPDDDASVTFLPLAAPLDTPHAELSDLAWRGDDLYVLPQYPRAFGEGGAGAIFVLAKSDLSAHVEGRKSEPLVPRRVRFDTAAVEAKVPGFDGFEAIVFEGTDVFVTVEARTVTGTMGYLARGRFGESGIVLDPSRVVPLASPSGIPNLGFEALTIVGDALVVFHEANGTAVVPHPVARVFAKASLAEQPALTMVPIDYRITAATDVDGAHRFWVMNDYWPGEPMLCPVGADAKERATSVERILELEARAGAIVRSPRPALRLAVDARGRHRNWEGLARFERGFLAVTDEHPETMLAYIEAKSTDR